MSLFRAGEEVSLPELARTQGFASDSFTVVDVIRGGMGVCAKVRQGQGPPFALKALLFEGRPGEAFEKFLVEMQTWLTLSVCDGIVEALAVFPYKGSPVVASRWMTGGNLRPHMEDKEPEYFYKTIVRIAGSLDWARKEHGILHNDLKPENVLIDDFGRPAISDWGIAGNRAPEDTVGEGSILIHATAAYASPEQLLGGVPLDERSDIYALGCIMFEWETGRVPFSGDFHEIRGSKIRMDPPRLQSGLFRKSRFGADEIINRALERERHGRHADWKAFMTDVVNAAVKRDVKLARFTPKMRYASRAVAKEDLKRKVAKGATVTAKGGAPAQDVRGAKRELDEALAKAAQEDWAGVAAILQPLVLPSVVREQPDDPLQQTSAMTLARAYVKLERPSEALAILDALAAASDKPTDLFSLLAGAHLALGHAALAERAARTGLLLHAEDAALQDVLFAAQKEQGHLSDAVATARGRLASRKTPVVLLDAAEALLASAASTPEVRLPEAIASLHEAAALATQALALAPNDVRARLVRARALLALERPKEVRRDLASIPDGSGEAARRAAAELEAACLLKLREYAACLAHCNRATETWPDSARLARTRALAVAEGFILGVETGGRRAVDDAAMGWFGRAVADPAVAEPNDVTTLARYREWTGRGAEALEVLRAGLKAFPRSWEISVALARLLERQGDFDGSLAAAQEATALAPFRPEAWRALAAAREILGPKAEADEARRKASAADARLKELRAKA